VTKGIDTQGNSQEISANVSYRG